MSPRPSKIALRDLRTYGRSRAPRLAECDYAGEEVIHVTICGAAGRNLTGASVAKLICENVEHYVRRLGYVLYGYCLMPDHLHVLLSPGGSGVTLAKWLRAFKSYTGHKYVGLRYRPPLWQRSAYDHVYRREETAESVLTYIVDNPVRAGLVERCWDWPWTRVFIEL